MTYYKVKFKNRSITQMANKPDHSLPSIAIAMDINQWYEAIRDANDPLLYGRKEFILSKQVKPTSDASMPDTFKQDDGQTQLRAYALRVKMAQADRQTKEERKKAQAKEDFLKGLLGG